MTYVVHKRSDDEWIIINSVTGYPVATAYQNELTALRDCNLWNRDNHLPLGPK